jgi:hypothetical protein
LSVGVGIEDMRKRGGLLALRKRVECLFLIITLKSSREYFGGKSVALGVYRHVIRSTLREAGCPLQEFY